ncbi:hypothetical protein IEQ34_005354 [Dendrobium chrysotoxum]|uniref:Uncharacterized protein n=1 Tax=Dendrobium chrysotoxum TaxID=161865 RepID=A0AAV7H8N2_DENCH|nr:hypothetical protein IEQ34_005354 [Dendrobium chrysotoxum]
MRGWTTGGGRSGWRRAQLGQEVGWSRAEQEVRLASGVGQGEQVFTRARSKVAGLPLAWARMGERERDGRRGRSGAGAKEKDEWERAGEFSVGLA